MNTTPVLTHLNKMRNEIAQDFNAVTQAIVSLGGELQEIKLDGVTQKQIPEKKLLTLQSPETKAEEKAPALPQPYRYVEPIRIPACYPPDCGVTEGSFWKDKILFALKELQNGTVADIVRVINKYEPGKYEIDLKNSITFNASIMSRHKTIIAVREGKMNRFFLPNAQSKTDVVKNVTEAVES